MKYLKIMKSKKRHESIIKYTILCLFFFTLSCVLKVKSIKNEEEVNDKVIFSKRITILSTSIYISAI